jgi:carboxymethylenebutenolidase
METFICHLERNGPFPGVFLLMDAYGVRSELKDIARRLGTVGYYPSGPSSHYKKRLVRVGSGLDGGEAP